MFDRPWPPSTATQAPVTQDAFGESRKTATFATSSAVPNRPDGVFSATKRAIPSGSSRCRRHHPPPRLPPHAAGAAGGGEVERVDEGAPAPDPLGRRRHEPLRVFGAQQVAGDGE